MSQIIEPGTAAETAAAIEADLDALPVLNTGSMRFVRRKYSHWLKQADADYVLEVALRLVKKGTHRWIGYELLQDHKPAFGCLGRVQLEELGQGINSWWTVDAFARTLSGPAWLKRQIDDVVIIQWAQSDDLWWRRAALVSTVALNIAASGGTGDTERTLSICRLLVSDHEDMVVKAMSWALRQLAVRDAPAVQAFLAEHDWTLAARVKREVNNKLKTGLKNPKIKP